MRHDPSPTRLLAESAPRRLPTLIGSFLLCGLLLATGSQAQGEGGAIPCVDGMAGAFPCQSVDLLSHADATRSRRVDAWTDPMTGTEYAIVTGLSLIEFFDLSNPTTPSLVGRMTYGEDCCAPTAIDSVVAGNVLYTVGGAHDLDHDTLAFDLERLRGVIDPPVSFEEDGFFTGFDSAFDITANTATGFLYLGRVDTCASGLMILDLADPLAPSLAGCWDTTGRIEAAHCVVYQGPDADYLGRELCFAANDDALLILDVTDKANLAQISRTVYDGAGLATQGSLTEDHAYFLLADLGDEFRAEHPTRTYLWDLEDLDAPEVRFHESPTLWARDQVNRVQGQYVYQANMLGGVRILDLHDLENGRLNEVAYFDTVPSSDAAGTYGGGAYDLAITDSGKILVSTRDERFFVLEPHLCSDPAKPTAPTVQGTGGNTLQVDWTGPPGVTYNVYRSTGACPGAARELVASDLASTTLVDTVAGQLEHSYEITAVDGLCESPPSPCASAVATGPCNAAPIFDGLQAVANPLGTTCRTELSWDPATPRCGSSVRYAVYRGNDPDFVPSPANLIATGLLGTSYADHDVAFGEERYYIVRALDTFNGQEDDNTVALVGSPLGTAVSGTWTAGAEAGDPELESTGSPLEWQASTEFVQSGDASYHSGFGNLVCTAMVSPPLRLTAGEAPMLTFWTLYDFPVRYGGGVLELSNDGGETWISRQPVGGYPWSFRSPNTCGYSSGHAAYTSGSGWQEQTFILTPWTGQEILLRWVYSSKTDGPLTFEGWWVDTISLSHVDLPQACTPSLFTDGFESGDTTFWTSTSP